MHESTNLMIKFSDLSSMSRTKAQHKCKTTHYKVMNLFLWFVFSIVRQKK